MLHSNACTSDVESVLACGLTVPWRKSTGHVGVGVQKNPLGCPVNGNEQVAPGRLVGHLRQILDVDVNEAWLVVFEGLPAQPSGSYAGYGHGAIGLARRRDRATCLQSLA